MFIKVFVFTFTTFCILFAGLLGGALDHFVKFLWTFGASLSIYLLSSWLEILPKKVRCFNFKCIVYLFVLLKDICISAITVIRFIWQRDIKITPIFEWIDIKNLGEIEEVVYGNSITLTPGTVTLDIKNNMLLVHALDKLLMKDLRTGKLKDRVKGVYGRVRTK